MPVKSTKKRVVRKISPKDLMETTNLSEVKNDQCCSSCKPSPLNFKKIGMVLLLIIVILGLLGFLFKDKFIVATINNKPIFRSQLSKKVFSSYAKETLENIIVENLIKEEVKKQDISITQTEIDGEIAKVSANLGEGTKLEDALKLQGMTLQDFREQILLRLQVNKLLEKEINITEEEINSFVKDNGQYLTASGEAERKTEATSLLKDQKVSARIQTWISELLAKAKITRFLK